MCVWAKPDQLTVNLNLTIAAMEANVYESGDVGERYHETISGRGHRRTGSYRDASGRCAAEAWRAAERPAAQPLRSADLGPGALENAEYWNASFL